MKIHQIFGAVVVWSQHFKRISKWKWDPIVCPSSDSQFKKIKRFKFKKNCCPDWWRVADFGSTSHHWCFWCSDEITVQQIWYLISGHKKKGFQSLGPNMKQKKKCAWDFSAVTTFSALGSWCQVLLIPPPFSDYFSCSYLIQPPNNEFPKKSHGIHSIFAWSRISFKGHPTVFLGCRHQFQSKVYRFLQQFPKQPGLLSIYQDLGLTETPIAIQNGPSAPLWP